MNRPTRHLMRTSAAIAALALLAGACGDDGGSSDSSTTGFSLVKSGTLTVCSDIPYAPFEYEDGGKIVGIDIEIIEAIATGLSLKTNFVDTDFDGIFAALAAKKCDLIASSVTITDERKKTNDFSDGYYEISQSLLVRSGDATKYTDLPTLKGKTVGVQSETTGAEFAKAQATANGYSVKEFTGADDMFTALKATQVDALLQDYPVNAYRAKVGGDSAVTKVFGSNTEAYGYVVSKTNPKLTAKVNEGLASLKTKGTYVTILEKYLGKQ